jgi:hypothetical protein
MKCARCFRKLTNPPGPHGMGPACERATFGTKPKRIPREDRRSADERQLTFEWVRFVGTTYGVGA